MPRLEAASGLGVSVLLRLQWHNSPPDRDGRRTRRIIMKRMRNIVKILMVGLASVFLVVWSLPVEADNGDHEGPSLIYIAK